MKKKSERLFVVYSIFTVWLASLAMGMGNRPEFQKLGSPEEDIIAISAGYNHCLALKNDGTIRAWGDNKWGKAEPPAGNDYTSVSAGYQHSLALRKDGSIVQWGYSNYGKIKPTEGNNFIAIAAGDNHSLALTDDGSIVQWGRQNYRYHAEDADFSAITIGGGRHLALTSDGRVYQLSNGILTASKFTKNDTVVSIATGGFHVLALTSDGHIIADGNNLHDRAAPPKGNDFIDIAASDNHNIALRSDGSIVCWGLGVDGQTRTPNESDFIDIDVGDRYNLALKKDGRLIGWGSRKAFHEPIVLPAKKIIKDSRAAPDSHQNIPEINDISILNSLDLKPKNIRLVDKDQTISMNLVYIKPGCFVMGKKSNKAEVAFGMLDPLEYDFSDTHPLRKVTLTKGFYIGKYKVTCQQFCAFLNLIDDPGKYVQINDYSRITLENGVYVPRPDCEDCAVNSVPWKGASAFCEWLSEQTGFSLRLPTEAEWEFTVRGSEGRTFPWGEDKKVEYDLQPAYHYKSYPHPWSYPAVDAFPGDRTPDGVVGMAGQGWEWCSDYYLDHYLENDTIDPKGPKAPMIQSDNPLYVCRSSGPYATHRQSGNNAYERHDYGFRVVVEADRVVPHVGGL